MTGTEIVGPLPTVIFGGGPDRTWKNRSERPKVAYVPPTNTLDPRYEACTDHHVACDCREAEFAEDRAECRAERAMLEDACGRFLAGHPTWQYSADGNELTGCMCTGCQIARACYVHHVGDPS